LQTVLNTRAQNALNGISGFNVTPLLTYGLAGKANPGSPSLYAADPTNFAPRVGIAWNPDFREGLLGSVFGSRKTVLRLGAADIYDHTALNAINFIEDQSNFIFSTVNNFFAGGSPEQYLAGSPRFVNVGNPIVPGVAPPFQKTVTPNVGP